MGPMAGLCLNGDIMTHLSKARIGKPEKPPLPVNGCATRNNTKSITNQSSHATKV
jgi:hypothetical protein